MSQRGKSRRIIQIWPFFVFFGMGSSISFVYAGVKHKMRNLVLFGVGYGLLFALAIAISEPTGGTAEEFSGTSSAIILGIWIASTAHAFQTNKKYRSEALSEVEALGVPHVPPPAPTNTSNESFVSLSDGYFATRKELTLEDAADVSAVPVDVNSADLQTLLTRLNLSPEDAERVLLTRQATGGFGQIEEFVQTAGLKPHEFAKIRNLVVITPIERENLVGPKHEGRSGSGRILDI